MLTVPIADAVRLLALGPGSPGRLTALVAALPWFGLLRHDSAPDAEARTITLGAVARTRLGWAMAAFFGLQSLQAYSVFGWFAQIYRDAGFSAGRRAAARRDHRDEHPAVVLAAGPARPGWRTRPG